MPPTTVSVMVLVKATPVLTSELQESMCVAGMTLGADPEWIRLHPVPFRDLADTTKFRKYQELTVQVARPRQDRRPESWTPHENTIVVGKTVGPEHAWSRRRERVASLPEVTMCDLRARNKSGSGPDTPSLGVVRTAGPPELVITEREPDQLQKWQDRAAALESQMTLFDDRTTSRDPLEVVPWRFRYSYRCLADGCNGHKQTIVDWEAVALYRNVRHRTNWQELMRRKFVDEMWASSKDTRLFVGNMEQRPWNFLILGVFWPPRQAFQTSLLG